ncbi:unnamed protein product, partial [Allacma fusca]
MRQIFASGGAGLVFPVESDKDMLSYVLK